MKTLYFLSIISLVAFGCKPQQKAIREKSDTASTQVVPQPYNAAIARVVIYKTRKYYNNQVPVILSDDKTQIVAYPHPGDLILGNNLAIPTPLHNGYLLDNRGIHRNVAFLKYTYEEYSVLKEVPSLQELQKSIIDKDPLTELWDCGKKTVFTNLTEQLNELIDQNRLSEKCRRIL